MTARPHPTDYPPVAVRTEALEALLTERGLVKPEALDGFINRYVNDVGPMNGAKVVAKAWVDPEYRERLLASGTEAIAVLHQTPCDCVVLDLSRRTVMRGSDATSGSLFSYVDVEERIPATHPLRTIRVRISTYMEAPQGERSLRGV